MSKVATIAIITNIPAPYRVDLFYYLQNNVKEYDWHIIYTGKNEDDREWKIDEGKLINSTILNAKIIDFKGKMFQRKIHFVLNISKHLDKINPDIVIAFEYNMASIQSLIWAKINKRKFISLTDGTLHSERNISFLQKLSRKIISNYSDAFIASSTKSKEKLLSWNISASKIFISYLTEDLSEYLKLRTSSKSNVILYVGSICERKGLDLLFKSLSHIDIKYELHIVGNGNKIDISQLKKLAQDLDISNNIVWRGYKEGDDLIKEYENATCFVLPTREDCFGLVLLEAAAANLPIVSSKFADGIYDMASETGQNYIFIADPYDETKFSEAIISALSKKESDIIIRDLTKFEFPNVSKGYVNAIQHVMSGRSGNEN